MANFNQPLILGVDVSSAMLDIALPDDSLTQVENTPSAISDWLGDLPEGALLAIEATGIYHEPLLDLALASGFEVYVINGKQLNHYREAVGPRAKTDAHDARLLQRYLRNEREQLSPVKPLSNNEKRLWRLLKRRATLIKARTQILSSAKGDPEVLDLVKDIVRQLGQAARKIERSMRELVIEQGWEGELQHCRSIPGIGPVNALALVACYHRGAFPGVDQFVAYIGLDVRVRDSGKMRGKRKLTKRGEPEMRRLLYVAAMTLARHPGYKPQYQQLRSKGMSATAAYVVLSRKLARIAFALMKKDEDWVMQA